MRKTKLFIVLVSLILFSYIVYVGINFMSNQLKERCWDKNDNDLDGFTDCDDSDCFYFDSCLNAKDIIINTTSKPDNKILNASLNRFVNKKTIKEVCSDKLDNDVDGFADCLDSECLNYSSCIPKCLSDAECGEDQFCENKNCEMIFVINCNKPCPFTDEYIKAKAEGFKKSLFSLGSYAGIDVSRGAMPIMVHITSDEECVAYTKETSVYSYLKDGKSHLCMYDFELNNSYGTPIDLTYASQVNGLILHELGHLIWLYRADVPFVFQEGFSRGVSAIIPNSNVKSFCHWGFEHKNAKNDVALMSENFWFRLCDEYGLTNDKVKKLLIGIERRSGLKNETLTLDEIKILLDEITMNDTSKLFTEIGIQK